MSRSFTITQDGFNREFNITQEGVNKEFTITQEGFNREFTIEDGIGSSGASAYQIALDNGFIGTEQEWLASLQGADADVTNAAVNAAIEDDPAATGVSLGLGLVATTNDYNDLDNLPDGGDFLPLAGGTMDAGADIAFANGSKLREGTTNAGLGGNGGIAQICSIDYELKWEAGRLYVMGQDGFTIRVEQYGFNVAPTATDDATKGYIVGSRRILDDGVAYTCTDSTEDAAVWRREYGGNTSVTTWHYRAKTTITTGNPTDAHVIWNNATQINATSINVSHKDQDNDDIEFFLGFIQEGQQLFLQDRDVSQNFQIWLVSGTPTLTGGGTANAYFTYPVTLVDSGGTGTTGFANNHQLLFGTTQALALHAPTHAIGGSDPLTPADIGALTGADQAETEAATITDKAVVPAYLRIKMDGTAFVAGDLTGDARGGNALDVQSYRNSSTQIASGAGAIAVGRYNTVSGGDSSAVGYQNTASGYYTTAFGYINTASNFRSSAFGHKNDASGGSSSAFGYDNTADTAYCSAFGYKNTASGYGSSAFGKSNNALGDGCVAVGNGNSTASGSYLEAVSIGIGNSATGNNSAAIGSINVSSGSVSNAFGFSNTASGGDSSAVGKSNTASGTSSSAFGAGNTVIGNVSSAFGAGNTASGNDSSAIGYSNTASGSRSEAIGYLNVASGNDSAAFGLNTTASAYKSTAFGFQNTASGIYSSSFGGYNSSIGEVSFSCGLNNNANGDYSLAFGNANTSSGLYSSAIGVENNTAGNLAFSLGRGNIASGEVSSAIGISNTASGLGSTALGRSNQAGGSNSSAFGYSCQTTQNNSTAIGFRVKSTIINTFEAGYWSNATTRSAAIRMHPNGQVAKTIVNSATAPLDGGATAGSEADARLPRGMYAIQKNGNTVRLYFNNAGTIQSLSLGTLA